jgi:hypothetical protein
LPPTTLRKDLSEIRKLLFVYFWYLWFWRRNNQGTFLQKISPLGVVVSEKKMFKEKLTQMHKRGHYIRLE